MARRRFGPGLLDSYEKERRAHVWAMIRLALRMGGIMAPRNRVVGFLTRAAFRALRVYPPASDYVVQMKYKPKPRFTEGFVVAEPGAGRASLVGQLFPQPPVLTAAGEVRLDTVLGDGFALLARTADPARTFAAPCLAELARLGARRVAVLPAGAAPAGAALDGAALAAGGEITLVGEVDRTFAEAFARIPDAILLLRPDHYVAAVLRPATAEATVAAVRRLLDETWATARTDAAAPLGTAVGQSAAD